MGLGLQSIRLILQTGEDADAIRARLCAQRTALESQLESTSRQIRLLDAALSQLRKDDFSMQYDVTLKQFPAMPVASVRGRLRSYADEGQLWHLLMEETASRPLSYAQPCYALAIFHDKEMCIRDRLKLGKVHLFLLEELAEILVYAVQPVSYTHLQVPILRCASFPLHLGILSGNAG